MTTTNVSAAQARAGLVNGGEAKWPGNITYSVPGAGAVWLGGYGTAEPSDAQYGVLTSDQATDFGAVMRAWDSLIAPSISGIQDSTPGQIRVAFTDVTARKGPDVAAYAYYPPAKGAAPPTPVETGDIWIDETYKTASFGPRTSAFALLLHEAGHTLGLKHSFDAPTVPAGYDSKTYTVMSYTTEDYFYKWSGGGGSIFVNYEATVDFTPMVLDILAIQNFYGADQNTAKGNTVYAFTDGDLNGRQAIYDAGGTDTLNLSALSRGSNVDLRPGSYSDLAYYSVDDQTRDLAATYGSGFEDFIRNKMNNPDRPAYEWERNLGLSFSTVIENVLGTGKADTIIGNDAANTINGGAGADTMTGGKGDDVFYVNTAADKVMEAAATTGGADKVLTAVTYTLGTGQGVERLETTNATGMGAISLFGNELAQTITGSDGANNLVGNGGNDTISARGGADGVQGGLGNDTLAGNGGNDNFYFNTALNPTTNVDRILDFGQATGNADLIRLENAVFDALGTATGFLKAAFFKANASGAASDGDDHIVYETDTGKLFYDSNGSTAGGSTQFATLTNYAGLTGANAISAADFYVY